MKPLRGSQKDLASWLDLGPRRVRELTTMGVLTQSTNEYDLKASVHAYLSFIRSKVGPVTDERSRLLKVQADMQELKVRLRKGEVVLRESVRREIFKMVRGMRDKMQNIPDRVAGVCAAETNQSVIHTILTKEIYQALEERSHADFSPTPPTQ